MNGGGTLLQTKASVQKLKSKQLTDFIKETTSFKKTPQLMDHRSSDEIPMICVRRELKFKETPNKLQDILLSYKMFRESEQEYPDYVTEENVDFM